MREGGDMPRPAPRREASRMSRRARVLAAFMVAVLFMLFISARGIANFYTDFLWFDSLGYESVWSGVLLRQVVLAVMFIAIMFLLLWFSLFIVDRSAPPFRPSGPEEEFVRRYHETIGDRGGLVRVLTALAFAVLWGATAGSQWQSWILFRNRVDFDVKDPQFDTDLGFYIFTLPFIQFLISWFFTAFVIVLIITAAAAYLNGGIRINAPTERVTPQVKAHLSVLLGALAIIKAIDYWFQRYSLTLSSRGVVDGASYADVKAQLPAIQLLILISICAAALLVLNIFRRGWVLPVAAVGLWAFVAIVVGSIFPAFFQRVFVEPTESSKEQQLIERNIAATRAAYGLDGVTTNLVSPATNADGLSRELFIENQATLENIRIVDPVIASGAFERLEAEREIYRFADNLDVDRYVIDGVVRPVLLAGRELNLAGARAGWENQHLGNTHGFGTAMALANETLVDGRPNFVVSGVGEPANVYSGLETEIDQQRYYIGEGLGGYAIIDTEREEVDYPTQGAGGEENQFFVYDGEDGVDVGGFIRRVAFGIRFGDWDPVFSGLINDDSRIIYNRDIEQRVKELAPFLEFDCDPYPVLLNGRTLWVVDAFTTSDRYPFSQYRDINAVSPGCDLRGGFNYVRNSVKAVVDAYDGTVDFYVVDPEDPIIQAYRKAFPDLFKDESEMPDGLQDHLRYPEDLFKVQTNMWGTYHLTQPNDFFDDAAAWNIAPEPTSELDSATTTVEGAATGNRIPPYYVMSPLPDAPASEQEFLLMRPFVPKSSNDQIQELAAVMYARNDPGSRGELLVYRPTAQAFDGPLIANETMLNDDVVAEVTTLLGQKGSNVRLGNMLLVPLDTEQWLWVRPLFVESDNNLPELSFVIVHFGGEVRMCPTVNGALSALFIENFNGSGAQCVDTLFNGSSTPTTPTTDDPEPTTDPDVPQTVGSLLERASQKFLDASAALSDGDLGAYQSLVDEAEELVARAAAELETTESGAEPAGDTGGGDAGESEGDGADGAGDNAEPAPTPTPEPGEA